MHWFKRRKSALIGIDIGARYLKLLEITFIDERPIISQYGLAELPMEVLTERHEIKNPATISATLLQLLNSITFHTRQSAIAISGSAVVTKEVALYTNLNEIEMEEQAWLEAGKNFPDLVEDLTLDFYEKENPNGENKNTYPVMLVACRKTSILKIIDAIKESNLEVEIVDVDYYALERILNRCIVYHTLTAEKTYALINFGAYTSTFIVVQNKKLLYSYSHVFDEQAILQRLQEEQKWADPILHIKKPDEVSFEQMKNSSAIGEIVHHINYALALFYSSKENTFIESLFLSGDCALIPLIDKCIETGVNIATKIATPTTCMPIASGINTDKLHAIGPALALCCGLALHEGYR